MYLVAELSFETIEMLQIISVKRKNDQKNTDTACSKKLFLQHSLNVGIAGDQSHDFSKVYPVPTIALMDEHNIFLAFGYSAKGIQLPKTQHGGFQCVVQKTSGLVFLLFNLTNKMTWGYEELSGILTDTSSKRFPASKINSKKPFGRLVDIAKPWCLPL